MYKFKTMIVNASIVETARGFADMFGSAAQNMWTTPLSATGAYPATHYVSTGMIGVEFVSMLESPEGLVEGANALGVPIDLPTANYLLSNADISDDDAFAAFDRLGLKMIQEQL